MAGQEEPTTLQAAGKFFSDTAGQMQSAVKGAADNVKAAVRLDGTALLQRRQRACHNDTTWRAHLQTAPPCRHHVPSWI